MLLGETNIAVVLVRFFYADDDNFGEISDFIVLDVADDAR